MKKIWCALATMAVLIGLFVTPAGRVAAAGITISANTLWSAIASGSGAGGQPSAADTIIVNNGATLTVDVANAAVGSIQLGDTTLASDGTLAFNAGSLLTVATLNVGDPGFASGGNVTMTLGGTLKVTDALNFYWAGATGWVWGTGTVEFSGTGPQSIPALTYNHLVTSGAGSTKTFDFIVNVAGNITLGAGTTNIAGSLLILGGNYVNNGTFDGLTNLSLVQFLGTGAQALTGATTFYDLELDNAAGLTLNNNVTVNNSLSLGASGLGGAITTGANRVIMGNTATVLRTSGHVLGNLQKYVATGATSVVFEVGVVNYNPVSVDFASVTTAGNLTASATAGPHPNIGTSAITAARVSPYWTITNTGTVFTTYSATFRFVAGDILGGGVPGSFVVGKYDGAAWTYPTLGTRTAVTTQANGMTAFSSFAVGEQNPIPTRIGFLTAPQTIVAGAASAIITLQSLDATGAPVNVGALTTVNLTSTSATGRFDTNPAGAFDGSVTSVPIAVGTSSANFYYKDPVIGSPVITAAAAGLTSGTQQETIVAGGLARIAFTTPARSVATGAVSAVMTIQSQDALGNAVNVAGPTVVNLSSTSGTGRFDTSAAGPFDGTITTVNIATGTNLMGFFYKDTTAGTPTLTAASFGLTSGTQMETVTAAVPTKLVFTTAAQNLATGVASGVITVQSQSVSSNPANVLAPTTINLTSSSATGRFDTLPGGPFNGTVNSVNIAGGANSANLYYRDTAAGTPTITAAAGGLTSGTQQETIYTPLTPTKLVITTAVQTFNAGVVSGIINIQTQDGASAPANVAAPTTVNLTSSSATGRFDTNAAGPFNGTITSVSIAAGNSSASFYYKDTAAGTPTLTTAVTGLTGGTQVETVNPSALNKIGFTSASRTVAPGAASAVITLQSQDAFGNPVNVVGATTINLTSTSGTGRFDISAIGLFNGSVATATIAAAGNTTAFFYKDTTPGTPTITAASAGLTSGTQQETIAAAGAPFKLVFISGTQSFTAGTVSGSITLQTQDAASSPANVVGITAVNLTSSAPTGLFDTNPAGAFVMTSVNIAAGSNSVTFYYRDSTVGTPMVTAASAGLTSATQMETILAAGGGGGGFGGGGGGGSGGGSAPGGVVLQNWNLASGQLLRLDSLNAAVFDTTIKTADGAVTLNILSGTMLLTQDGKPLPLFTAARAGTPPQAPPASAILSAWDFGPDGATFNPGITLTMVYDPKALPAGVTPDKLTLAFYNGKEWVTVPARLDTATNTLTALITHFTVYAVTTIPAGPATPIPAATVSPARFNVGTMTVNPASVKPGDTVTVALNVTNTGGTEGKYTVTLKIDGAVESSKDVTLKPGETQPVSFAVVKPTAKAYQVAVDTLTGSFTVASPAPAPTPAPVPAPIPASTPTPATPGINWLLIGLIAAAVLIAIGVSVGVARHRRNN